MTLLHTSFSCPYAFPNPASLQTMDSSEAVLGDAGDAFSRNGQVVNTLGQP